MFKNWFKKDKKEENTNQVTDFSESTYEDKSTNMDVEEDIKDQVEDNLSYTNDNPAREEARLEESLAEKQPLDGDYDNIKTQEIGNDEPLKKEPDFFQRLKSGLLKAKSGITDKIDDILGTYAKVDDEMLEEIEEVLITADVGVSTTMEIIQSLEDNIRQKKITDPKNVKDELKDIINQMLSGDEESIIDIPTPAIIVVVGVNGVGKTTTIGKLAARYKNSGKKVMLAAADTFRAAASEQLDIWAKRNDVDIVKHGEGADPGAVVFDAIKAAQARNIDVLICDTAGRLHNKTNLMKELSKIFKIIDREYAHAHKETLLVVDATTGQNAVIQAKTFKETADITGIALTKLDGTAKGGVVLAVKKEVDVPVRLIGVGEGINDLQDFNSKDFIKALFGENN